MRSAEFEKVAELLARQHTIKVMPGEGWAANIKNREVFYKKKDVYTLSEEHILGLLLHEIAHIHYTTDTPSPNTNQELFHSTMNMLEDHAIEHIISFDYPNAGEILAETKEEVLDTLVRVLPTLGCSIHEKCLLYASTRFEGRGYTNALTQYEKTGDKIAKLMLSKKDQILNRKRTNDLFPIAEEIMKILVDEVGKPTDRDKDSMRQGMSEGKAVPTTRMGMTKEEVVKMLGGPNKGGGHDWWDTTSDIQFIDSIADQSNMVGKRLRSILKRNNAMEFGGRFRTGKLRTKNIIRTRTIKDRRPFGRRIVKSNKSYAFAIASDVSGSMFNSGNVPEMGDFASRSMSSLYMVSEALRIAGIPRSLIAFGEKAVVLNEMGSTAVRWSEVTDGKKVMKAGQSDTDIASAIRMGVQQLQNQHTERKVLIVLTDGGDNYYTVKQEVDKATKLGIECIGITLGSASTLHEALPKGNSINLTHPRDPREISNSFIKVLDSTITRSK